MQSLMGETTPVAHGGDHGKARVGETPKTALPPQDRTGSPRPRCIAVSHALREWFVRVRLWRGLRPSVGYAEVTVR
ncbi:hypothetical protein [Moorena bouillonii]|uniref:hypothetical protein n=1 Tax=Moorena bouillonii TaxID=207920 RepID=UPI0011808B27|nr:hypothetical protein [Moorena bouillonii]